MNINNDWYYEPPQERGQWTVCICTACQGTGEVEAEMVYDHEEPFALECPLCSGTGEIEQWVDNDPDDYPDDDR